MTQDDLPTLPPRGDQPIPEEYPTLPPGFLPSARATPEAATYPRTHHRPLARVEITPVEPSDQGAQTQVALKGQVFGGRFTVIEMLGQGAMGSVFRVRDEQIDKREVALKLLRRRYSEDRAFRDLFFREIRTAQGFVSEHVVQVRDVGQLDGGQLFLTMDLIDGESLSQLMLREKTLAPRHALEIARQMLLGLASGHEQGFIHRDVKPQNVMLAARVPKTESNPFGVHALLLDFGIAGLVEEVEGEGTAGTPAYMSPEQVNGQRLDPRSDLFAIGVCLYEMISGKRPFQGKTIAEITSSVLETDLVPMIQQLDGLSKPIRRILRKALQKEREKRFPSAAVFIEAIESSSAFKAETGVPRWVMLLTILFGLGAASSTYGMIEARTRALALQDAQPGLDRIARQHGAAEARAQIESMTTQLTNAERERDKNAERVAALTKEVNELKAEVARKVDEFNTATNERQDQQAKASTWATLYRMDTRLLLNEHIGNDYYKMRQLQTAELFDRVLSSIERGTIDPDRRVVETEKSENRVVESRVGIDYLERLEGAARYIAAFSRADQGGARIQELSRARRELAWLENRAHLEQFVRDTSSGLDRWLGVVRRSEVDILEQLRAHVAERARGKVREEARGEEGRLGTRANHTEDIDADSFERQSFLEVVQEIRSATWRMKLHEASFLEEQVQERYTRLEQALEHLNRTLDEHETRIRSAAKDAAASAAKEYDVAGAVLQMSELYGTYADPFIEELLEVVVSRYEGETVDPEGRMDIASLRRVPGTVEQLTDMVDDRSGSGEPPAPLVERLQWLAAARAWYWGGSHDLEKPWQKRLLSEPVVLDSGQLTNDWRAVLALKFQLSREDARLPMLANERAVYEVRSRSGDEFRGWEWVTCGLVEGRPRARRLQRERLDEYGERATAGTPPATIPFERPTQWSFSQLGDAAVDLRRFNDQQILGVQTWVPSGTAIEQFGSVRYTSPRFKALIGRSLASVMPMQGMGYPCLVVRTSAVSTAWFHPVLGLVREDESLISRSLVHLDT